MSIFNYLRCDKVSSNLLIAFFLFPFLSGFAISEPTHRVSVIETLTCNEINASFEVVQGSTEVNNSIVIDLKGTDSSSLMISLVGPKKLFLKDVQENEIKNLARGIYSLVITGRNESSSYCPKHFQVIIK